MIAYSDSESQRILLGWQCATMIKGVNPHLHRKDRAGRVMNWIDYENRQSRYGWKLQELTAKHGSNDSCSVEAVHLETAEGKAHVSK